MYHEDTTIYLYVKTHTTTGLKYLGKTIRSDVHEYTGSGRCWLRHLAKPGKHYTTEILLATADKQELKETGIFFSQLWNIVESTGWANLMLEAGCGGRQDRLLLEGKHNFQNPEVQRRIQQNRIIAGTHNLLRTNRTPLNGRQKGSSHITTKTRNLSSCNPFRGYVPCVDMAGSPHMISQLEYASQIGPKEHWQFVHTKSKVAIARKSW